MGQANHSYVIETDNTGLVSEHGRAVMEAVRFEQWFRGFDRPVLYRMQSDTSPIQGGEIPVGSVDWVQEVSGTKISPLNLPESCIKEPFVKRGTCFRTDRAGLEQELTKHTLFIKSDTGAKVWPALITQNIREVPEDERYFCSTAANFLEEWRAFVFGGVILDVKQYAGSWGCPLTEKEVQYIRDTISLAALPLPAYTVDIGRSEYGMEWIEVHPFISCGLYGFDDPSNILRMTNAAWKYHLKQQKGDS